MQDLIDHVKKQALAVSVSPTLGNPSGEAEAISVLVHSYLALEERQRYLARSSTQGNNRLQILMALEKDQPGA